MPLNLVILIDKQGPIFYIPLHAHEPICFCSSVYGWCGLAPAVYNVLAPHEPGPVGSGIILDTVDTSTSARRLLNVYALMLY